MMAKVTWLGEDEDGVAGPSFTTCYGGKKFPKGEAVELTDPDQIKRASANRYFSVEIEADAEHSDEPEADELKGMAIADLRNLAEASGIDHAGMSKAELRDAIRAHDEKANGQDPG